jgi:hypothetical protein
MGREEGIPVVPPKLVTLVTLFVPTNISLSSNVEITVQTTKRGTWNLTRSSPSQLERELQLISVECNFQHACGGYTSLAASASLLSSVTAFI